jgi:hypothetical protein
MEKFPKALRTKKEFDGVWAAYEQTFHAVRASMQRLLNIEAETLFFNMVGAVDNATRKQALGRLLRML